MPPDFAENLRADVESNKLDISEVGDEQFLFYIDGPGGSGKTFLYNTIINYVNSVLNLSTIAVAWTGIAVNLLLGGRTCHRTFRLTINLAEDSVVGWLVDHDQSEAIRDIALILWDEASMTHRFAASAVDRYLRELSGRPNSPIGGFCCLFGGDFHQVLPVVSRRHRAAVIEASLKRWPLWKEFRTLPLVRNMRILQIDDNDEIIAQLGSYFPEWLLRLGEGRIPYASFPPLRHLPADLMEMQKMFHSGSLEELIRFVYDDNSVGVSVDNAAILCPANAMVFEVNNSILTRIQGDSKTFFSIDSLNAGAEDEFRVPVDVLNSVDVATLPPHELTLKVGAVVILLRNLHVELGECNGTRMRVVRLGDHVIVCDILTGERGHQVWLSRIKMIARDTMIPHEVVRFQFPIRLVYAMTFNKS